MAPGSAVAATGRLRLLSLASFGLISGACFFVGYYLLRRYRKTTHQKTDDSSEAVLTAESVETSPARPVSDPTEKTKEVDGKTLEETGNREKENGNREKKVEEKDENKKEEEGPMQRSTITNQHASASGTLTATESDRTESLKDLPIGANVKDYVLDHDDSSVTTVAADIGTKNEQPAKATAESESRSDTKEAKTTGRATGSEPRLVAAPKDDRASRPDAKILSTKQEPRSVITAAAEKTVQKPSSSQQTVRDSVEAATVTERKSDSIGRTKSAELTAEKEQQSAALKRTKVAAINTEKQSKSEQFPEIKSAESVAKRSTITDGNERKAGNATAKNEATSEAIRNAVPAKTFNGAAGKQSEATPHIKATEATTKEESVSATTTVELRSGRERVKSPETLHDREHRAGPSRSAKSHIPELIRRLSDDVSVHHQESMADCKAELEAPVASSTEKYEAKSVGKEQPVPAEFSHSESEKTVRGMSLNVDAAEFRPHKLLLDVGAVQELTTSTGRTKGDRTTETNPSAHKTLESSPGDLAPSLTEGSGPMVLQKGDHVSSAASDDSSTLIVRSTKSLAPPLSPLTPPPDSSKQSRRQRDRGIRGSQGTVDATPAEPSSEGGGNTADNQSRRSRHRWPPLDDKTLDRVEVDTGSQQVSWKTNKKPDSSSGAQSPWSSSSQVVKDEASSSLQAAAARRKAEFDDNFVDPAVYARQAISPVEKSEPTVVTPRDVTKQSSLLDVTPDCAMERKPLISEDDDDDDDVEDHGDGVKRLQSVEENGRKNGSEAVTTEEKREEANSNEDAVKLVEIDQSGMGSLAGLVGEMVDPDVRLASLRALVNLSWATEKHPEFPPILDQLCSIVDSEDVSLKLESLRILVNLSKNPAMVPHLLAAKAPSNLLKLLVPEISEDILINWLTILDDILWTSKELCLTFAALPTEHRAASPETLYTGLYGLKNARILKSRIFVLSRHKSQQVTYLASRIYSCLTS